MKISHLKCSRISFFASKTFTTSAFLHQLTTAAEEAHTVNDYFLIELDFQLRFLFLIDEEKNYRKNRTYKFEIVIKNIILNKYSIILYFIQGIFHLFVYFLYFAGQVCPPKLYDLHRFKMLIFQNQRPTFLLLLLLFYYWMWTEHKSDDLCILNDLMKKRNES